jgi:DNA-binding MarR family transcriptional regulator
MPEYQNVETGEIQLVAIVRRKLHTDGFTIVFQEPLLAFLTGPGSELTALELRLYLYLWATVEYANVVEAYIAEIAIGMGTDGRRGPDRSSVSKALRRLEELDLITREHLPG